MNLPHFSKAITLTADMIEQRDCLRALCGDRYEKCIAPVRQIIRGYAAEKGLQLLPATLELCQRALENGSGGAFITLIAAVVDLMEGGK